MLSDAWKYLEQYPPCSVRLLARRRPTSHTRAVGLTNAQIALASGLTVDRIDEIGLMKSWAEVTVAEAMLFCRGCDFDPTSYEDRKKARSLESKGKYAYLRRSPDRATVVRILKAIGGRA